MVHRLLGSYTCSNYFYFWKNRNAANIYSQSNTTAHNDKDGAHNHESWNTKAYNVTNWRTCILKKQHKKTHDTSTKNFVCMCAWVLGSTRSQITRKYLHGHIVIKFMPQSIISPKGNLAKANPLNHIDMQTFVNETISSMHASALKDIQTKRNSSRLTIFNDNQQTKHYVQHRNLESPRKRL